MSLKPPKGAKELDRPRTPRRPPRQGGDEGDGGDEGSVASLITTSQASRLIDVALRSGIELWHTPDGDAYCSIDDGGHREHYLLHARHVRGFLARLYYGRHGKTAPSATAIQSAIGTLAGMARFDGTERVAHLRTGKQDGNLYVDLGDAEWRAVEIGNDGWRIVNAPAIRFRRPRGLRPLPAPQRGGTLDDLQQLLNLRTREELALAVAWLLQALLPSGPYPTLILTGEQGTAKSTVTRVLRQGVGPGSDDGGSVTSRPC